MAEAEEAGLGASGLSGEDPNTWPEPPEPGTPAHEILKPGSDAHSKVLEYLTRRIEESERAMSQFYDRWEVNEKKVQAYLNLPDYEKILEAANNRDAKPPQAISIIVPYSFAVVATIVTYLLHTFCGRKPMLQVGAYKQESIEASRHMEQVLQYQAEHTRLIRQLYRWFNDGEVYGLGVLRTAWTAQKAMRTTWKEQEQRSIYGQALGKKRLPTRSVRTVYSGNTVECVDPFMFFPDPRVPMVEVNRRGEYVFWRSYIGKHVAKRLEADGDYKYVSSVTAKLPENRFWDNGSQRTRRAGGESTPGELPSSSRLESNFQCDEGTVEIIPRELGLSESTRPEKWLFTILNKQVIVRAVPFDADHDMHPVAVSEPYEMGYGFGNLGMVDIVGPLQDTMSFLINSHITNVRAALNNMFIVDPSMIEMQDLLNPEPGKLIRLKRAAFGMDVRQAIYQMQVTDITAGSIKDLELFMRFGQFLTAISENLMGVQDSGGRKTATEVRTTGEAAASRLAAHARKISSQGLVDLTEQMCVNTQQYLDENFYIELLGEDAKKVPLKIDASKLNGDFHYPVSDGTLPLDRVALMDIWKEVFMLVGQDPQLRQQFDLVKIFEWLAELGGARNIESFKIQVAPPAQLQQMQQLGQVVPISPGMGLPGMGPEGPGGPGGAPMLGAPGMQGGPPTVPGI